MLNCHGSHRTKAHLSPVRLNPLLQVIPVHDSRCVRMPVGIWREFRVHIMIDQVGDQKRMQRLAIAIHVNPHSQTIYRVSRLFFRRILLDTPNDKRFCAHASRYAILSPEKLPAIRSGLSLCTPEVTPLIMPAHLNVSSDESTNSPMAVVRARAVLVGRDKTKPPSMHVAAIVHSTRKTTAPISRIGRGARPSGLVGIPQQTTVILQIGSGCRSEEH